MKTMRTRITRRGALHLAAGGVAAMACTPLLPPAAASPPTETSDELDAIAQRIQSGGPPPDGIPPIERPKYVTTAEADKELRDDAVVDGIVSDGRARAYPRFITVWHEIVNETFGGDPVSITYCPLTGSTLVFSGVLAGGRSTTFGTSGSLYNSNLVMYDRATSSWWPQLLGVAVKGERKGERLRELPLAVTTTYGRWKARFRDTLVLSRDTGHLRAYGNSPYGDYDTSRGLIFPASPTDERFHPKTVVVGVRLGDDALAIPKDQFAATRVAQAQLGGASLVALYDEALDVVRVFKTGTPAGDVRLVRRGDAFADERSGLRFSPEGEAADGIRLERVVSYSVMWFAWFAFNPRTQVLT